MKRKDFLKITGTASTLMGLGGISWLVDAQTNSAVAGTVNRQEKIIEGAFTNPLYIIPDFDLKTEKEFKASPVKKEIIPNGKADVFGYHPEGLLGKSIVVNRGDNIDLHFTNETPIPTNVHWHGCIIPPDMDGFPSLKIKQGESYQYQFKLDQRAGTYWIHPHPDMLTGIGVAKGLAAFVIVEDDEEKSLKLPSGEHESRLVIQDKRLDKQGQLLYAPTDVETMTGYFGNYVLVNGTAHPYHTVKAGWHRFRLLNGSNARIYNLSLGGKTFYIIGSDGGLLTKPSEQKELLVAPGERVDILVDFTNDADKEYFIQNELFSGDDDQGKEIFKIMKVKVSKDAGYQYTLPQTLSVINKIPVPQATKTRTLDISNAKMDAMYAQMMAQEKKNMKMKKGKMKDMNGMEGMSGMEGMNMSNMNEGTTQQMGDNSSMQMGRTWNGMKMEHTINDIPYNDKVVNLTISRGTTEIWEFDNSKGDESHPMHVHGVQFQVVSRIGGRNALQPSEMGFKDTVLCMAGEKVSVIMKFETIPGKYILHCHNLEHEDSGMMWCYELV